jgi:hypothetical protein
VFWKRFGRRIFALSRPRSKMPSASSALAASLGAASQREKKAQGRLERALKERDEYAERAEEAGKLVAELSYANKRLSKEIADAEVKRTGDQGQGQARPRPRAASRCRRPLRRARRRSGRTDAVAPQHHSPQAAARAARERQVRACRYLQRGLESYEEASAAAFERAAQQLQRVVGALSALQAASGAGSAGGGAHAAARHLADAFAAAAALGQLLVPPRAQPPEDTDPDPQPSATGRGSGGAVESGEGSCAGGCGCGCSCCGSGVELRARVAVLSSQLEDARFEADEMARRMAELLAQADRGGFSGSASSRSGDGGGGEGMQSARTVDAKAAAEAAAAAQQQAEALAALASAQADVQAAQEEVRQAAWCMAPQQSHSMIGAETGFFGDRQGWRPPSLAHPPLRPQQVNLHTQQRRVLKQLEELRRAHTAAAGAAESLRQRNASLKRALAARWGHGAPASGV